MEAMADGWLKTFIFMIILSSVQVLGEHLMNITRLHSAVAKGAVCLDGSPPAYYLDRGIGKSADNWIVYLEGGGWCGSEGMCVLRASQKLGNSSKLNDQTSAGGILSANATTNPEFSKWTRAYVRYCDGGSFMGDIETVDPKNNLHIRGARIFQAVLEDLQAKGLKNAKNAMLAGNSAGGLSTMLHCDNFRAQLPNVPRVKCVADSGYFIRAKNLPGADSIRDLSFGKIVEFHGMSKNLPKSCTSKMDPKLCLYPENFVADIKTPLFLVNSAFDMFQLENRMEPVGTKQDWRNCTNGLEPCSPPQVKAIQDFHNTFMESLPKGPCWSRGMFIDTCLVHDHFYFDQRWNGPITVNRKTIAKAVKDWFFDRSCARDIQNDNFFHQCA